MEKLIITAALTGNITLPAPTPYLPLTPKDQHVEPLPVGRLLTVGGLLSRQGDHIPFLDSK